MRFFLVAFYAMWTYAMVAMGGFLLNVIGGLSIWIGEKCRKQRVHKDYEKLFAVILCEYFSIQYLEYSRILHK